ncbi:MAG: NAD-dependent epimerase/dehydratase family protein [Kiritimatiellae bacterium]|nr:NAD-dependent epimerase/dehydratase family protein [Kiritimatiellia bacterium]
MMSTLPSITSNDRILLTGATGFTGGVLARKLCATGAHVRAIARASSDISPLSDLDIEWVRGDVYDPGVVREASKDVTYVFSLATAYREGDAGENIFQKVHVDATKRLAEEAAANPGLKRFVHVSTVGVHGHIDSPPADENYRWAPGDTYQETKAEAERWITAFAKAKNVPLTIIRPAAIYGPGDRRLLKLFKMAAKPVFVVVGRTDTWYHLIHVEDLCDAMMLAAVHPAALHEPFICGNPDAVRVSEIGRIIATTLGKPFRLWRLPAGPLFAAAAVCEAICKPFGISPPLYKRRVAFFTKDRRFDTRKLHDVLGFEPRFTDADGLRETAQWYIEKGWLSS